MHNARMTSSSSVGLPGGLNELVWGELLALCLAQLGAHLGGWGEPCGWVRVLWAGGGGERRGSLQLVLEESSFYPENCGKVLCFL